jgi:PAS domain S-box-containing protein
MTGKFLANWEGEPKKRVNLSLTETAWDKLNDYATSQNLSKSEVIELYARSLHPEAEQRQAEDEIAKLYIDLQRRVTELQTLLDVIPVGIAVAHDPKCQRITTNPYFAELLGVSASENSSRSSLEAQLPYTVLKDGVESAAEMSPMQMAAAQGIEIRGAECDVLRADGTVRHLLINAAPLFDEQEQVRACLGAFVDITESKQTQQALQESEARFRAAVAGSFDAIYILESVRDEVGQVIDFRFIDLNDRGARLIYSTKEAVIGQKLCELLPINRTDGFFEKYKQVVETGVALEEEFPISVPGIAASWLHHQVIPLKDGIAIISRDISEREAALQERKQAEANVQQLSEQVQEQAKTLNAILSASTDHIYVFDRAGRYRYISESGARALGVRPDEVVGKNWRELGLLAAVMEPLDAQREQVMATGQSLRNETTFTYVQGVQHHEYVLTPLQDLEQPVEAVVAISRDITERKQSEEALQAINQTLQALVQASPLAIISMDKIGKVKMWSPAAEQIFGWTAAEAIDQFVPFVAEDNRSEFSQFHQIKLQGDLMQGVELHRHKKDGSPVDIAVWGAPLRDSRGNVNLTMAVIADISDRKRSEAERKQVEAALQETNQTLQALIQACPLAITAFDLAGKVKLWNPAAQKVFGWHESEVLGQFLPCVPEAKQDEFLANLHTIRQGQVLSGVEAQRQKQDGTVVDVGIWAAPLQDAKGNISCVSILADITERKRSEAERMQLLAREQAARAEAEAAQRQLTAIFETSPVGIGFLDQQQRFVAINEALAEINGLSREQHLGRSISELFGEDDPALVQVFETLYATGIPFVSPSYAVNVPKRSDRRPGYYNVYYLPTIDRNNQVDSVLVYVVDVTERVRLEEAQRFLAEASTVLSSSLDYQITLERVAQLAVPRLADWCVVDVVQPDGFVERLATAHVDPTQVSWAQGVQRRYPLNPSASHGIAKVLRTGQPEYHPEISDAQLVSTARDDEHLQILRQMRLRSVMIVPLLAQSRILGAISFLSTESGRRYCPDDLVLAEELARRAAIAVDNARLYGLAQRDRAQAEAANRMKDEFLATLSHELRTPLNAMLGWTQMLRKRNLNESTTARALETVDRNTRVLSRLIEDLLDVSRIITGKLRLNLRAVELASVIEAALETVDAAADAKEIQIETELDPLAGAVVGDPDRLQQVVWNLLSNAVKFTPNRGRIQIRLARINAQVQIQVHDSGKGISPDFLPHVFDRFRQADSSITRSFGGLGLGMAIVRHLTELHGGTVEAASPGEGQGATFTIKLPLMTAYNAPTSPEQDWELPASPAEDSVLSYPSLTLKEIKVLVVDDEADARELVSTILQQHAAEVKTVATASEAMVAIESYRPHILLSDIGMPEEDGYTLIRRIRALEAAQGGRIPAVALTAYAREEDRTKVLLAGFQQHLPKPVVPAELVAIVASLTGRTYETD